jgi:hypothetical protein
MRGAALAIALAAIPTLVLADSTVDLRYVLAYPPAADYIEVPASSTVLDGPFTAQQYADYATANGQNGSRIVTSLRLTGFKRGYARTWVERGTHRVLIERVFELSSGSGAKTFYDRTKLGTQVEQGYLGLIDTPPTLGDSFGAKLDEAGPPPFHDCVAALLKGNDVYEVVLGSETEDLTSELLSQLGAMYETTPPETIPRSQWTDALTTAVTNTPGLATSALAAGVIVLVFILGLLVLIVVLVRRGSRPQIVPIAASMSPDGRYWWDGWRWRDASFDPPPMAPRSPDGAYWWDGRMWRPLPVSMPPGY